MAGHGDESNARHTPETLRIRAVSATLTVDDLKESLRWYTDVVGFTLDDEWREEGQLVGASLVAGSLQLYIAQDDWAKGRDRSKGVGFRLVLQTAQDVDAIAAGIEARGGALLSPPADMPWGTRAFTIKDPDGFVLTISSEG